MLLHPRGMVSLIQLSAKVAFVSILTPNLTQMHTTPQSYPSPFPMYIHRSTAVFTVGSTRCAFSPANMSSVTRRSAARWCLWWRR